MPPDPAHRWGCPNPAPPPQLRVIRDATRDGRCVQRRSCDACGSVFWLDRQPGRRPRWRTW